MVARRRTALGGLILHSFVLICGTGCVQLTQTEIKALETREMDLSYDDAYKAAANGLFSLGFTIEHSDKQSGILTGHRKDPNTGAKIGAAIFFGVIGLLATGDRDWAVTFMVEALEPKLTQLRMKVVINGKSVVDREFMTKIWQQLEREAMLESRPSNRIPSTQPKTSGSTAVPREHRLSVEKLAALP
jgi:hypothetical protein